jgi:hypothetical protein
MKEGIVGVGGKPSSGKYESTNYQLANNSEEEWGLDEYRNHFSTCQTSHWLRMDES